MTDTPLNAPFKIAGTEALFAEVAGNVGDAPHVTRILTRAIARIERFVNATITLSATTAEDDETDEARQQFALREIKSVMDSLTFTLRGKAALHHMKQPPFTSYAKAVIQRTYSGNKDGMHETWADIVERVIETTFYFYKVQLLSIEPANGTDVLNDAYYNEDAAQDLAMAAAIAMFNVQWMPAGRGVQMCRLALVRRLGSMMCNNCGFVTTGYSVRAPRGLLAPAVASSSKDDRFAACPPQADPKYVRLDEYNENKKRWPYGVPDASESCPDGRTPEQRVAAVTSFLDAVESGATQLMSGVGVGFDTHFNERLIEPDRYRSTCGGLAAERSETFVVPDNREGWAASYRALLASYLVPDSPTVVFDYTRIRPKGARISTFGGTASGPHVLEIAHHRLRARCECLLRTQRYHHGDAKKEYGGRIHMKQSWCCDDRTSILIMLEELLPHEIAFLEKENPAEIEGKRAFFAYNIAKIRTIEGKTYDDTRWVLDVFNDIGVCTRMGNLRRSAEIALGSPSDRTFFRSKDYDNHNPERADIGLTSNNSVQIYDRAQYAEVSAAVAAVVGVRGEPGIVNMVHVWHDPAEDGANEWELQPDSAEGFNPCGETPLEPEELCNLVETFPCNCKTREEWLAACQFAALYGAVMSCIPTGSARTNAVIARNHRIGVSQTGLWQFYEQRCASAEEYTAALREAYAVVRRTANAHVVAVEGVVPIRVTVLKPSGTLAPLGNAPPGVHPPIESRHVIRRMRVARIKPLAGLLKDNNVPHEVDAYDPTSYVFDFPLDQGDMRSAADVTMWELGQFACLTQDAYVDNATSLSLYVDPNVDTPTQIASFLKMHLHRMKSLSFMTREAAKILHLNNGASVSIPYFADHTKIVNLFESIDWAVPASAEIVKNKPRSPYVQAPYETISAGKYAELAESIGDLDFAGMRYTEGDTEIIAGCDGMKCSRD